MTQTLSQCSCPLQWSKSAGPHPHIPTSPLWFISCWGPGRQEVQNTSSSPRGRKPCGVAPWPRSMESHGSTLKRCWQLRALLWPQPGPAPVSVPAAQPLRHSQLCACWLECLHNTQPMWHLPQKSDELYQMGTTEQYQLPQTTTNNFSFWKNK